MSIELQKKLVKEHQSRIEAFLISVQSCTLGGRDQNVVFEGTGCGLIAVILRVYDVLMIELFVSKERVDNLCQHRRKTVTKTFRKVILELNGFSVLYKWFKLSKEQKFFSLRSRNKGYV